MKSDPHPVPDGEEALRRMFSEPAAFTDTLPPVASLDEARRRRARLAGLLTIAAAAVTAGVLVTTNLGSLTTAPAPANTASVEAASEYPTPTPTPTPSAFASPTPTPTPTAAPVAWTTFTDSSGQATFELPVGWTVQETLQPSGFDFGYWGSSIVVMNEAAKVMAKIQPAPDAAGAQCSPVPYSTLDAVALDIPQAPTTGEYVGPTQFKFRIIEGAAVYGAMAVDSSSMPATGSACQLSSTIQGPNDVPALTFGSSMFLNATGTDAQLTFASVAEAEAYMQTQEYKDIKRMLVSLSLKPTSRSYVSVAADASFKLPLGWTAQEVPAGTPDFPAAGIQVSDETGKKVASFYHGAGGGLGGACGPETYKATELDAARPALTEQWAFDAGVRFSYRVLDQTSVGKGFSYQVGLVDKSSGQLSDSCLMYSVVSGTPRGTMSFADRAAKSPDEPVFQSMAEAKAYMETPEYKKLRGMIMSLKMPAQG